MSQNPTYGPMMRHLYYLVQYQRELEAAMRYVQLAAGGAGMAPRIILGLPPQGRHAAVTNGNPPVPAYQHNQLGVWRAERSA